LTALTTLSDLVGEARLKVESDFGANGAAPELAKEYADSVATYLAFVVSRQANRGSTICIWDSSASMEAIVQTFARQAIPMTWDFAEGNPLSNSSGNLLSNIEIAVRAIPSFSNGVLGTAGQRDARTIDSVPGVIATDPPYYDNIGYADLSDYFYVWLRLSLRSIYPELFNTMVTPKAAELIATPYRHRGSKADAASYFEDGFIEVFGRCRQLSLDDYPISLFYAFKQSETSGGDGIASTGWATMLEGLASAGLMVTATWPMRTELTTNLKKGVSALASSVSISCRRRPVSLTGRVSSAPCRRSFPVLSASCRRLTSRRLTFARPPSGPVWRCSLASPG